MIIICKELEKDLTGTISEDLESYQPEEYLEQGEFILQLGIAENSWIKQLFILIMLACFIWTTF